MWNQWLSRGVYLATRYAPEKGVWHYAVVDSGGCLTGEHGSLPVIVELTPTGVVTSWFPSLGPWKLEARAVDEQAARSRYFTAARRGDYTVGANNCEHFAREVVTGRHESLQVQLFLFAVGAIALWAATRRAA